MLALVLFLPALPALAQADPFAQLLQQEAGLYRQGRYTEALPLAQQAIHSAEASFPKNDPRLATALNNLADLDDALGDFAEAESACRHALAIREQGGGAAPLDVAQSLNTLAQILRHQGRYAEARPLYERALAIREKALGPAHPGVAEVRNNLGRLDFSLGDYDRAREEYESALRAREKALGPGHPDLAISLSDLGELDEGLRDYAAAEPLLERALAIREKALGPEHPEVAQTLTNLANLYRHQGRYGDAAPLAERALRIDEKVFGPEHRYVANALNNLALLEMRQGRYPAAEQLYERALRIREKALGPEHPEVAQSLNDLADLFRHQQRFDDAERLYLRALRINEKALGPNSRYVGTVLNNLAALYGREGKYSQAEELARRALRLHEEVMGNASGPVAMDLTNLAAILNQQDRPEAAAPLLERALAIWERLGGADNQEHLASVLVLLATLDYGRGQPRLAEPLFARAFDLMARQLQAYFTYGSEKDRLDFVERNADRFPLYFSFVERSGAQEPDLAGRMYDLLLWQKGVVVGSIAALRRQVQASDDKEALRLLDQLAAKRAQIAALLNADPEEQAQRRQSIAQLEAEANRLERELVKRSAVFAQHQQFERATWQQVRAALRPGDAAVEFVRFPFYGGRKWTGDSHYVALVIPSARASAPLLIALGDAKPVEKTLLLEYRQGVQERGSAAAEPGAEAAAGPDAGAKAYELLWKPVEAVLAGAGRVYLAPDGALNQVPLGLIPLPDGRLLMEKYDLRLLSSTKDLLRAESRAAQNTAVLVGDPDFEESAASERAALKELGITAAPSQGKPPAVPGPSEPGEELTLPPLPGTGVEIQAVQGLLQKADWQVKSYTEERALEEIVKRVPHPRLLHVATHGFFRPDQEQKSGADNGAGIEDPMLRSGLLFAGADRALGGALPPPDLDDGVLTALEAAQLNLQGTELVVLSACDTGRGSVRNGEGVFGLRRALTEAGAQAVMMSLWPVPDQETQELMALFYKKWTSGMGKHEALRQAQLEMRARVRERYGDDLPYYWGAFVMVGR